MLLAGIGSGGPAARDEAADAVTDVVRALSGDQVDRIARALVAAVVAEQADDCREAELNALDDLAVWHPVDRAVLVPALGLDRSGFGEPEREYLVNLDAYVSGED